MSAVGREAPRRRTSGRSGQLGRAWHVRLDCEEPIGITDIARKFELDTDADPATVKRLVEMIERFLCHLPEPAHAPQLSVMDRIGDGA